MTDPYDVFCERDRIDALLDRREPPPPTEALEIIEKELQKFYSDHPEWREAVRVLERTIEREERLRVAAEAFFAADGIKPARPPCPEVKDDKEWNRQYVLAVKAKIEAEDKLRAALRGGD